MMMHIQKETFWFERFWFDPTLRISLELAYFSLELLSISIVKRSVVKAIEDILLEY